MGLGMQSLLGGMAAPNVVEVCVEYLKMYIC